MRTREELRHRVCLYPVEDRPGGICGAALQPRRKWCEAHARAVIQDRQKSTVGRAGNRRYRAEFRERNPLSEEVRKALYAEVQRLFSTGIQVRAVNLRHRQPVSPPNRSAYLESLRAFLDPRAPRERVSPTSKEAPEDPSILMNPLATFHAALGRGVHCYVFCYTRSRHNAEDRPFEALVLSDHPIPLTDPYYDVLEAPEFYEQLNWWRGLLPWSGKGMFQVLTVEVRQRHGDRFGVFLVRHFERYRNLKERFTSYRRGHVGHLAITYPRPLIPAAGSEVEEIGCVIAQMGQRRRGRLAFDDSPMRLALHVVTPDGN